MEATLNISRWIAGPNFFFLFYICGDNNIQSIEFGVYYSLSKLPCQVVASTNLDWVVDCDIYNYIYEVMSHDQQF